MVTKIRAVLTHYAAVCILARLPLLCDKPGQECSDVIFFFRLLFSFIENIGIHESDICTLLFKVDLSCSCSTDKNNIKSTFMLLFIHQRSVVPSALLDFILLFF